MDYSSMVKISGLDIDIQSGTVVLNPKHDLHDYEVADAYMFAIKISNFVWLTEMNEGRIDFTQSELAAAVSPQELFQAWGILLNLSRQCLEKREKRIREKKDPARSNPQRAGYVYLLRAHSGLYKIGFTKNPDHRIETFSVKLPFEVEFEALINTDNMHQLERGLHVMFDDKRVNGEWFNLSPEDVAYIKSLQGGNHEPNNP